MEKILLIGGGGHCKSVIDVIEEEQKFTIGGIIDKKELVGEELLGYKFIGTDDDLSDLRKEFDYALITLGQLETKSPRRNLYTLLKDLGFTLPSIISPRAHIGKDVVLGEGCVVMHDALINSAATVGVNTIINSKALIEHDTTIGDHCHIATGAILNGGVELKDNAFVGSGAIAVQGAKIEGFVKAGSIVK